MKRAILVAIALTSCAQAPNISTRQSALVCDPWCDPDEPEPDPWDQRTMGDALGIVSSVFPDGTVTGSGCVAGTVHHSECWVEVTTSDCDFGTVDCVNWGSGSSDCQVSCE